MSTPDDGGNGWNEWRKHVLAELGRNNSTHDDLQKIIVANQTALTGNFQKILTELAVLRVKAGVWGLLGGIIPAIGVLLLMYVRA